MNAGLASRGRHSLRLQVLNMSVDTYILFDLGRTGQVEQSPARGTWIGCVGWAGKILTPPDWLPAAVNKGRACAKTLSLSQEISSQTLSINSIHTRNTKAVYASFSFNSPLGNSHAVKVGTVTTGISSCLSLLHVTLALGPFPLGF